MIWNINYRSYKDNAIFINMKRAYGIIQVKAQVLQ